MFEHFLLLVGGSQEVGKARRLGRNKGRLEVAKMKKNQNFWVA